MAKLIVAGVAAVLAVNALAGCATLAPAAAVVELDHTSHITQHVPFRSAADATNYGTEVASVGLKWQPLPRLSLVVEDGLSLDHQTRLLDSYGGGFLQERHYKLIDSYGGTLGPRETFNARVTYEIPLR